MPLPFLLFAKDNAFKEGTHQKYNIAVNGKEIQITGGEIGSWNDGGEMGDINLDVKTGDEENNKGQFRFYMFLSLF